MASWQAGIGLLVVDLDHRGVMGDGRMGGRMVVDAEVCVPSAGAPRLALSTGLVRRSFRSFGGTGPDLGALRFHLGGTLPLGRLRD